MMNHRDLVHAFENGAVKGKSNSMFIDGDVLYSYGYHYPLAVRHPGHEEGKDWGAGVQFIVNDTGYSRTTSKHIGCARSLRRSIAVSFADLCVHNIIDGRRSVPTPENFEIVRTVRDDGEFIFRSRGQMFRFRTFYKSRRRQTSIERVLPSELLALDAA